MKYLSILEQPTREAIEKFAEKRNLTKYLPDKYQHPQEDYLLISEESKVFVVSDGVTLDFKKFAESDKKYPNPSPAGIVAEIFCKSVIVGQGNSENVKEIFEKANDEVRKYNDSVGQSEYAGNPTNYYSATGSFVVIKDKKAYWASICDSFVAHFDKDMNLKHMSSGSCRPYAVINGESRMSEHLETGVFDLEDGDKIFVFTDGFEHYVKNKDFLELFKNWDNSLRSRINSFSEKMNDKDPEKYGHERSLIAVCV